MKKYLLFVYEKYYPLGGINDLIDSYDSIDEIDLSEIGLDEFYQIVDKETMKIIKTNHK